MIWKSTNHFTDVVLHVVPLEVGGSRENQAASDELNLALVGLPLLRGQIQSDVPFLLPLGAIWALLDLPPIQRRMYLDFSVIVTERPHATPFLNLIHVEPVKRSACRIFTVVGTLPNRVVEVPGSIVLRTHVPEHEIEQMFRNP